MAQLGYFNERKHEFTLSAAVKAGSRYMSGPPTSWPRSNGDSQTFDMRDDDSAYLRYAASKSPRENVPFRVSRNSDPLHQSVLKSWQTAEPTAERKREVAKLLETLTHTINYSTSLQENPHRERYQVDAFGSMAWGGNTGRSGDLDLVIIDTFHPFGYHPNLWRVSGVRPNAQHSSNQRLQPDPKVPQLYDVEWLARFMRNSAGMLYPKSIPATTPIVKFQVRNTDLECDINVNDLGGWYNSRLILAYCEISPHVLRPLIHALKKWLASYNLNDSSGTSGQRSMSSYCITLMAIAYLQHVGELPNLQEEVQESSADPSDPDQEDVIWVSWGRDQGQVAHIGFRRTAPQHWRPAHHAFTVGHAIRGFFKYFNISNHEFNYTKQFVSMLNGGTVDRQYRQGVELRSRQVYWDSVRHLPKNQASAAMRHYDDPRDGRWIQDGGKCTDSQPTAWGKCKLVVQDPFLWGKNCAGTMEVSAVNKFISAVSATSRYLESNQDATLTGMLKLPLL